MESRPRHRRLGRHAGRRHHHHDHVSRPRLLHCRDGAGAAAYRGGVFLRAFGDGSLGRLHHRPMRECRVRSDPGGHRLLHRLLYGRHLRDACKLSAHMVDLDVRRVPGPEYRRRGALVPGHSGGDSCGARRAHHLLDQRHPSPRFQPLGAQHRTRRHRAARRERPILPVRNSWRSRHAAFRRVAVPGDRAVAASGGGIHRSQARHAEGDHSWHADADRFGRA